MGVGNLTDRSSGQTITDTFFNSIHDALEGDFVGRSTAGTPESGHNLGSSSFPWGTLRCSGIVLNGSSLDVTQVSAPPFRVVSGKTRSGSNQPQFLIPAGTGSGAILYVQGSATNLVFETNGSSNTLQADLTKSALTTAPSTNNTALVNDTDAADGEGTRLWGEDNFIKLDFKNEIVIDTVGSEISSLDGKTAAFLKGTEVFLARVDTTNNRLHKCKRGWFYDESGDPLNRDTLANNDTLTLLKLGWVFLDDDLSTVDVTYNEPVFAFSAPSSPVTGDYWYDLGNALWKRYDGASFQSVDRAFLGWIAMDDTDCIAARSVHFDAKFLPEKSLDIEFYSTEIMQAIEQFSKINVAGQRIDFGDSRPNWNITTDLASSTDMNNATEQASTDYYLYVTDEGEPKISDIAPHWRPEMFGGYHPHNPWRFVGEANNDSGSDLGVPENYPAGYSLGEMTVNCYSWLITANDHGSSASRIRRWTTAEQRGGITRIIQDSSGGDYIEILQDGMYQTEHYDACSSGTVTMAISKNAESADLTTSIFSVDRSKVVFRMQDTDNTERFLPSIQRFKKGDILRAHDTGINDATAANRSWFKVTKVGV